jgi:hypothetical protein
VSGNRAVISYVVDQTDGEVPIGELMTIFAIDNRGPISADPVPPDADRFANVFLPESCPPFPSLQNLSFDYVNRGDIAIHDALPLPTSKDQCKNGGYAQFGFKNQGQCVAFVERGPTHSSSN